MTEKEYAELVKEMMPKSPIVKDCINAFWIGGLICVIGQFFNNRYLDMGMEKQLAGTAASMTLVALSALLTGLSIYDNIAKHAGAGTLVPITGFANAVAAPAVEFKTEGMILGTAAKMFHCRPGDRVWCFRIGGLWADLLAVCDAVIKERLYLSTAFCMFRCGQPTQSFSFSSSTTSAASGSVILKSLPSWVWM